MISTSKFKKQWTERTTRTTRRVILGVVVAVVGICAYFGFFRPGLNDFEIVDQLGGNLFPSAILSVATTDAEIIKPMDGFHVCWQSQVALRRQDTERTPQLLGAH